MLFLDDDSSDGHSVRLLRLLFELISFWFCLDIDSRKVFIVGPDQFYGCFFGLLELLVEKALLQSNLFIRRSKEA